MNDIGDPFLREPHDRDDAPAIARPDSAPPVAREKPRRGGRWLAIAAVLPLAGAKAGQAHTHAEQRLDAERLRLFQRGFELGGFFDDDEYAQPELASDQGQAQVFAILVAVADHDAARFCQAAASPLLMGPNTSPSFARAPFYPEPVP